jgi:hypothetical protein
MFAGRKGSLSTPVIKHGKFVLSFYSIFICKETEVRESPNDSTLVGGEGQDGRGQTCHPQYRESSISSVIEHPLAYVCFSSYKIYKARKWMNSRILR